MFQKGRPPQPIKYRSEVLKLKPDAKYISRFLPGSANGLNRTYGAIYSGKKRISDVFKVAWKAWEDAYYKIIKPTE